MSVAIFFAYASAVGAGALALATVFRAGRSLPRWAFAVGMAMLAIESVLVALSISTESPAEISHWQTWRLIDLSMISGTWLLFSFSYARGKTGKPTWWYYASVGAIILPACGAWWFREHLVVKVHQDALSGDWLILLGWPGNLVWLLLLIGSVWVVVNIERTFRASVGTMRWRIKFMLFGVGMLFVVRIYTSSQVLLFRGINSSLESLNSGALLVATLLVLRSFFRTGHFDLEVYPSQSVLQNSLTVLLAGAYLLIVGVLAKIVTYIGGDTAFALKAFLVLVSLVVLTIVLQSDRARLQLRQFVSRHFRRSPYDYRAVWKTFTEGTASRVEQTGLCRELARLIAETFQALSVAIWILDDKKESLILVASTFSANQATQGSANPAAAEIIKHFQENSNPSDIESRNNNWATTLRECHPTQFEHGGNRVCVPMIGRDGLIGVITIGDRVGGVSFSVEDFDMLKCVGDHAAASLLNVQLSTKLLEAKELEAFQAMAAFFVHDLKNAASTLNLMLQNLPVHYDDPAFREDALRGISKTVAHINRLIGRLGALRHELKIDVTEADLNEVLTSVLTGVEHGASYSVIKDIRPLPKIPLDRDQMHKVITNLVLNATEAVGMTGGQVHIETNQDNGWVVLSVADNGCGMSPDFLSHSLFRPFQTTKKNGLGIGMFQSKMIIEAHGGRISVSSEPGKGTTFRVFLRATANR